MSKRLSFLKKYAAFLLISSLFLSGIDSFAGVQSAADIGSVSFSPVLAPAVVPSVDVLAMPELSDGIRKLDHVPVELPRGVTLDSLESFQRASIPAAQRYSAEKFFLDSKPLALDVDLKNDPSVDGPAIEKAIRDMVDSDPSEFGVSDQFGRPSERMAKVHVQYIPGVGDQADSYIAVFRRMETGKDIDGSTYKLLVDDANMRFHIKIIKGKALVMAAQTDENFAADINSRIMTPKYSDVQLDRIAAQRLRAPSDPGEDFFAPRRRNGTRRTRQAAAGGPVFLTRSITKIANAWRAINIYQASGLNDSPLIVVVDINTGKAWAFDAQDFRTRKYFPRRTIAGAAMPAAPMLPPGLLAQIRQKQDSLAHSLVSDKGGQIKGSVTGMSPQLDGKGQDHGPVNSVPLPNVEIQDVQGNRIGVTNADGTFVIPASADGKKIKIALNGIYGPVTDDDPKDPSLAQTVTAKQGQILKVEINPAGKNEQLNAVVAGYVHSYGLFDWFKNFIGLNDSRLFTPLAGGIHANGTDMIGNAFYDPSRDGFFLMKQATAHQVVRGRDGELHKISITFENTAQPSIMYHELGHRFVQMASQLALTSSQQADRAYRYVKRTLEPVIGADSNEPFADIVSMFKRGNPILGNGFILSANPRPPAGLPNVIRTGENKTKYDPGDSRQKQDPHARGEVLMGMGWGTYQDLIKRYGLDKGAEYAAKLFVRTLLYIQPGDVISAMNHILIADMTKDGKTPNADIIESNALKHGVDLTNSGSPTLKSRARRSPGRV